MKRTGTSKRSSKPTGPAKPERPRRAEPADLKRSLSAEVVEKARLLASQYSVLLRPSEEHGCSGTALEFPTVFVHGRTAAQCEKKLREALTVAAAFMLHAGEAPPLPANEERRTQQVNVRLTSEEKLLLEEAARRRGYRGLSDFVRAAALGETRRSA